MGFMGYWHSFKRFSLMAIAATTMTFSSGLAAYGKTPASAPVSLTSLLTALETAANEKEIESLLSLYSNDFVHSDGLDKDDFRTLLTDLWADYPQMTYETELLSWEQKGDRLVAETLTTIQGIKREDGRWSYLDSEIKAKQYFVNNQLVEQEILTESSKLTSGDNPPSVSVLIPETVAPKEDFGFDVIVNDPLGDDLLLGGALEQLINDETFATPEDFDLDILPAGGIFKRVEAPEETGDVWYSAIIIRSDGITLVSHRVKVQDS